MMEWNDEVNLDDPDNPEWTAADFARARPSIEVLPREVYEAVTRRPGGRPIKPVAERKRHVSLRLQPSLIEAARATGPGWQRRAEQALRREFMGEAHG